MEEKPKCEYCGCEAEECLAQCCATGRYFCNGKGDTFQSHIVHHLRSLHLDQIKLLPSNSFAGVDLQCYVCQSRNIFRLGFVHNADNSKIFIACRSPCQMHDSLINEGVDTKTFTPIISNGEIMQQILPAPAPDQYHKITISHAFAVSAAIKRQLDGSQQEEENLGGLWKARNTYKDVGQYVKTMTKFVERERDENEALEKTQKFSGIYPRWENDRVCTIKAPPALYRNLSLGASVKFTSRIGDNDVTEVGAVIERNKNMVTKISFRNPSPFAQAQCSVTAYVVFNSLVYERQLAALEAFGDSHRSLDPFIADCILGKTDSFSARNRIKDSRGKVIDPPEKYFKKLNPSQIKAIEMALSQRFTMIQGPPGTGKTTTIAALALSFVKAGITPVLVCAQSNVATDFATLRVAQTGVNVVRVLSSNREEVSGDIDNYTTKNLARNARPEEWAELEANRDDEASRKKMTKDEIEEVRKAQVVCTTCTSAGGARLTGGIKFPVVIFDESGQCLDPDLLIPLVHGCRQVVLVGDHRQLGPVVMSRQASRARYDMPLMQRMIFNGIHPHVLRTQYRMHPGLAAFASETFYSGLLKDGVTAEHRTWPTKFIDWPNPEIPLLFWNIQSQDEFYESGLSYVNRHEAGAVAVILERMWQHGVKPSDVGVITPYAGQQAYLIEELPRLCNIRDHSFFDEIEIASVDAFQGREKNFIILSNVRANDQHDLGFVKDMRRLCVSLTRARYGLIVLGCASTFAENPLWCRYIRHCQEHGVFVEGNIGSFVPSRFTPLADESRADFDEENNDDEDGGTIY